MSVEVRKLQKPKMGVEKSQGMEGTVEHLCYESSLFWENTGDKRFKWRWEQRMGIKQGAAIV